MVTWDILNANLIAGHQPTTTGNSQWLERSSRKECVKGKGVKIVFLTATCFTDTEIKSGCLAPVPVSNDTYRRLLGKVVMMIDHQCFNECDYRVEVRG